LPIHGEGRPLQNMHTPEVDEGAVGGNVSCLEPIGSKLKAIAREKTNRMKQIKKRKHENRKSKTWAESGNKRKEKNGKKKNENKRNEKNRREEKRREEKRREEKRREEKRREEKRREEKRREEKRKERNRVTAKWSILRVRYFEKLWIC
jgi:hypothetical protein